MCIRDSLKDCSHRNADRAAIERVATARRDDERIEAKRSRITEDRTHIRMVRDVFEHGNTMGICQQISKTWQGFALHGTEHPARKLETRELLYLI